ncbi:MAG: hypothetical protein BRC34_00785 [Cyanobacteria bacterium QH_1_48_107]|nr:MAG: hypothetical protein BRC34_00785 [Cyanobacteria bacterium QH_1_48_107]PSO61710.1 MAG: hypothetical protein BRC39_07395 [Cyanobacteria bacterium QH_7_48_89]
MSEEQPRPTDKPERNTQPSEQLDTESQQTTETTHSSGKQNQSFLKGLTVKALRGITQLLEGAAERLEPTEKMPAASKEESAASVANSQASTQAPSETTSAEFSSEVPEETETTPAPSETSEQSTPAASSSPVPEKTETTPATSETPEEIISAESSSQVPEETTSAASASEIPEEAETAQSFSNIPEKKTPTASASETPQPTPTAWQRILERIRSRLPGFLDNLLPDWALTAILMGTLVALVWATLALLPEESTEVAETPPAEVEAPPEIAEAPPAEVETPPEVPEQPQPQETSPLPKLKLTPEQSLIAAIQNQVAEMTNQYAEGLIQSIEANFQDSRLIVEVSEQWYELPQSQQSDTANGMLRRSRELDFSKLEVTDPQGTLLARSPVVGSKMVILK